MTTSKRKNSPGADRSRHKYKLSVKEYVDAVKLSTPCFRCGEMDPVVKQFHHRPGEVKLFNIGNSWRYYSIPIVAAEIAKCRVLCANCHLREHAGVYGEDDGS